MSKPIKPTPILKGKDADRFIEETYNVRYDKKKARELERSRNAYEIAKRNWNLEPRKSSE